MRAAIWLAWREVAQRRSSFIAAVVLVAVAVALCVSLELVSRAREFAVSAEVDHMGPPIRIIPAGRSAADLARHELGRNYLTEQTAHQLRRILSHRLRALEKRLLLTETINGRPTLVAGVKPGSVISPVRELRNLRETDVLLGAGLSKRLGVGDGDTVSLRGRRLRVTGILPITGTPKDLVLYLPLKRLQQLTGLAGRVNELRLYPLKGTAHGVIVAEAQRHHSGVKVVQMKRGVVADRAIGESLRRNRWLLYLILSAAVALSLLAFSFLNASERGLEMATLVALGGRGISVFCVLASRAALVGGLGAFSGYLVGAAMSLAQDYGSAIHAVFSVRLAASVFGAAIVLSVLGSAPISIRLAIQKHVHAL